MPVQYLHPIKFKGQGAEVAPAGIPIMSIPRLQADSCDMSTGLCLAQGF